MIKKIIVFAAALAAVASHGAWNELLPVPKSNAYTGGEVDATALERVTVRKAAVKAAPKATADEAYRLVVAADGVTVEAATERGVRYAKVTLAQLRKLAAGESRTAGGATGFGDRSRRRFMPTARWCLIRLSDRRVQRSSGMDARNLWDSPLCP